MVTVEAAAEPLLIVDCYLLAVDVTCQWPQLTLYTKMFSGKDSSFSQQSVGIWNPLDTVVSLLSGK